jgi:hypothetical protein
MPGFVGSVVEVRLGKVHQAGRISAEEVAAVAHLWGRLSQVWTWQLTRSRRHGDPNGRIDQMSWTG